MVHLSLGLLWQRTYSLNEIVFILPATKFVSLIIFNFFKHKAPLNPRVLKASFRSSHSSKVSLCHQNGNRRRMTTTVYKSIAPPPHQRYTFAIFFYIVWFICLIWSNLFPWGPLPSVRCSLDDFFVVCFADFARYTLRLWEWKFLLHQERRCKVERENFNI